MNQRFLKFPRLPNIDKFFIILITVFMTIRKSNIKVLVLPLLTRELLLMLNGKTAIFLAASKKFLAKNL